MTNVGTRLNGVTFLTKTDAEFGNLVTNYSVKDIPNFGHITRTIESWKGILKKISSALSTANSFNSDIKTYFNDVAPVSGAPAPPDGEEIPLIEVRGALRDMLKSFDPEEIPEEKSLIPGIKELPRQLLRAEDFVMVKESISKILDVKYAEFIRARSKVEDISDLVRFGEVTNEQAKARCSAALNALDAVVVQAKYLFQAYPDEEIQQIIVILV